MELNFRDKKLRKDDGMDFTKLSLKELNEQEKNNRNNKKLEKNFE